MRCNIDHARGAVYLAAGQSPDSGGLGHLVVAKGANMKTWLVVLVLVWFAGVAGATPGRVDSLGCHNSKKYGWHCHVEAREKRLQACKSKRENKAPRCAKIL